MTDFEQWTFCDECFQPVGCHHRLRACGVRLHFYCEAAHMKHCRPCRRQGLSKCDECDQYARIAMARGIFCGDCGGILIADRI